MKRAFHGAIGFTKKDGYTIPRRFTDEQAEHFSDNEFFKNRTRCCASITVEVITTATRISFDIKDYFMDDFIHPNALGMEVYGNNLVKTIKKIKF